MHPVHFLGRVVALTKRCVIGAISTDDGRRPVAGLRHAGRRRGWPLEQLASRKDALDSGSLLLLNRRVAPLKRIAATGAALLMVLALASVGIALHEHDADVQAAGHGDCDACHFRHLSGIATDGPPASSAPDLVAHAVVSAHPEGERGIALGIRPTRGPPA